MACRRDHDFRAWPGISRSRARHDASRALPPAAGRRLDRLHNILWQPPAQIMDDLPLMTARQSADLGEPAASLSDLVGSATPIRRLSASEPTSPPAPSVGSGERGRASLDPLTPPPARARAWLCSSFLSFAPTSSACGLQRELSNQSRPAGPRLTADGNPAGHGAGRQVASDGKPSRAGVAEQRGEGLAAPDAHRDDPELGAGTSQVVSDA